MYRRSEHRIGHKDGWHCYDSPGEYVVSAKARLVADARAPESPCAHVSKRSNRLCRCARGMVIQRIKESDEGSLVSEVSRLVGTDVMVCHATVLLYIVPDDSMVPIARELSGMVYEHESNIRHSCHCVNVVLAQAFEEEIGNQALPVEREAWVGAAVREFGYEIHQPAAPRPRCR